MCAQFTHMNQIRCDSALELMYHLFLTCPEVRGAWEAVCNSFSIKTLPPWLPDVWSKWRKSDVSMGSLNLRDTMIAALLLDDLIVIN